MSINNLSRCRFGIFFSLFLTLQILTINIAGAVVGLSQKTFEKLQLVQGFIEQQNFTQAHKTLDTLLERKLNTYELAQVYTIKGNAFSVAQKYEQAIPYFIKASETKNLPAGLLANIYRQLSQLYLVSENYTKAIHYIDLLIAKDLRPNAALFALKAQCYYELNELSDANTLISEAISSELSQNRIPQESWFLLKNAILHESELYEDMALLLTDLIRYYPHQRYLYNLAAVYGQLEKTKEQLALLEALYDSGYLVNKNQIVLLVQLYLAYEIPIKAAYVLESFLSNNTVSTKTTVSDFRLLAQAWILAREPIKAVDSLVLASQKDATGNSDIQLAQTYLSLSRWTQANEAALKSLEKGDLRDEGNAWMMLGMSYYRMKAFNKAIEAFSHSQKFEHVVQSSQQWSSFVKKQQEKFELAQAKK